MAPTVNLGEERLDLRVLLLLGEGLAGRGEGVALLELALPTLVEAEPKKTGARRGVSAQLTEHKRAVGAHKDLHTRLNEAHEGRGHHPHRPGVKLLIRAVDEERRPRLKVVGQHEPGQGAELELTRGAGADLKVPRGAERA